jgi:hypothetical protein
MEWGEGDFLLRKTHETEKEKNKNKTTTPHPLFSKYLFAEQFSVLFKVRYIQYSIAGIL